jgi:hypothetical protein
MTRRPIIVCNAAETAAKGGTRPTPRRSYHRLPWLLRNGATTAGTGGMGIRQCRGVNRVRVVSSLAEAGVERVGNADGLEVVADLGLVVPGHRQSLVAPDTVQPQLADFLPRRPVAMIVSQSSRRPRLFGSYLYSRVVRLVRPRMTWRINSARDATISRVHVRV